VGGDCEADGADNTAVVHGTGNANAGGGDGVGNTAIVYGAAGRHEFDER
jgi:hypothetical protein